MIRPKGPEVNVVLGVRAEEVRRAELTQASAGRPARLLEIRVTQENLQAHTVGALTEAGRQIVGEPLAERGLEIPTRLAGAHSGVE
jgi:hypothetical protein